MCMHTYVDVYNPYDTHTHTTHTQHTARVVVVKISGHPILCKTDEIGEICVQSMATGSAYWGLQGKSTHTFRVSHRGDECITTCTLHI